jgi:hypothetical protein
MMFFIACCCAGSRHDDIVNKKRRTCLALLQCRYNRSNNLDAFCIVVVVENLSDKECIRLLRWLRLEEVVLLKLDTISKDVVLRM